MQILNEIAYKQARNLEKTERIKGYFLNMFKRICLNIDMKGEMLEAIKERKHLYECTVVGKKVVTDKSKEIDDAKAKVEQLQTTFEQSKVDFDKALVQKANALEDLTALHERTEKAKTA